MDIPAYIEINNDQLEEFMSEYNSNVRMYLGARNYFCTILNKILHCIIINKITYKTFIFTDNNYIIFLTDISDEHKQIIKSIANKLLWNNIIVAEYWRKKRIYMYMITQTLSTMFDKKQMEQLESDAPSYNIEKFPRQKFIKITKPEITYNKIIIDI
jgi:hypothetical protein